MLSKIIKFLTVDIWRIRLNTYPRSKSFWLRQLRVLALSLRGFIEDKCKFRASALTFFSLLSIVPVVAMMFGIAKGFGLEEKVRALILTRMQGQEEIAKKILVFSDSLLENASGNFIAGVGVLLLFWSVIKVLSNIEDSFNSIWGVKTPRTFARKFSDYISMVLVCPFLLILASSMTVAISSQVKVILENFPIFNAIGPFIFFLLKLLPYCTLWIVFTFIFIFMPNTKVKFTSALIAGIVAGTIFQLAQWGYINFQIGVARSGAIYGTFAALPLFLIWLQLSWFIVLYGAELSFAHQNVDTYEFEQDSLSASNSFKRLLSLLITNLLVKNFCNDKTALNAGEISHKLEIPIRLVRLLLFELVEAKVLATIKIEDDKDVAYQPATDISKLSIAFVTQALENRGIADIPVVKNDEINKLSDCMAKIANDIKQSEANVLLKDI